MNVGNYKDSEELKAVLNSHIEKWSTQFDIQIKFDLPHLNFAYVIEALYKKFNKRVVILIDEYDKPLIATMENLQLQEQYRSTLKAFYSVIKSANDYIHLSFLTGITKFSKVSIFSDLNNLLDISFDDEYSSLCGITEEELKDNFLPEIEALSGKEGKTFEEMLSLLRQKYDGYRFSKKEERIYNPFSVCNAFYFKELGNYWFESGTPTFMVKLLEQRTFDLPNLEGKIALKSGNMDVYRVSYESLVPLLFQAGYLTIKNYDKDFNRYILGYPNDEVKYAFLEQLMKVYTSARSNLSGEFMIDEFVCAIKKNDIDRVLNLIKALLASIPYDSFPKDKLFLREHNYQTAIYLIFRLMGQYIKTEVHSSTGRSDAEVETVDAIYIFEFKVGGKPIDAITQIKEAGYAEKYGMSSKSIYLIGATIGDEERTLDAWEIERV